VRLNINGAAYDPTDPVGKMFFTLLSMFAEFEADLISQRT
jgi:DNA invertase Pin-like site-specific DNA recombinase